MIHPDFLGSQKTPKQKTGVAWPEVKEVVMTPGQPGPRTNLPLVRSLPRFFLAYWIMWISHVFTKTTFLIGLSLNQLKDADHAACPELNSLEISRCHHRGFTPPRYTEIRNTFSPLVRNIRNRIYHNLTLIKVITMSHINALTASYT